MTIEWLAGNRIRGTTAERPLASLQSPSVGGWVELGRTTLGSTGDDMAVTGLANKRYYMILNSNLNTYYINTVMRCNADTGNNYALRSSLDGATDTTNISVGYTLNDSENYQSPNFRVAYASNLSGKEKLLIHNVVTENASGAGTVPRRTEGVGKWSNTSEPIDEFNVFNYGAGSLIAGSEIVVLGFDPDDTHTSNFWEELASVELTSASMRIDSGTFTAKKYLWIQIYNPVKISGGNTYVYYNNVTSGGTHSGRSNTNGRNPTNQSLLSDYELTSSNGSIINHDVTGSGTSTGMFTNMFVINNASNEKLSIIKSVSGWTNAGAGVAPVMFDCVGKWSNTTDAITSVQCGSTSHSTYMGAGSIIKVWGHD